MRVPLDDLGSRITRISKVVCAGLDRAPAQLLRGVLIPRVGDEPRAQPLLDLFGVLGPFGQELRRNRRQERPRLQEDQGRRDDQILGRDLDVEVLDEGDVVEVLPRDRRERHGDEDIELTFTHEVEQQIERSFEDLDVDLKREGRVELGRQRL